LFTPSGWSNGAYSRPGPRAREVLLMDTMKGTVKYGDALSGTWTARREAAKK